MPKIIALIPARAGSKRLSGKNVRPLAGHPLMAYTITAALESKVFDRVVVSTDSEEYADIARHYGAEIPFLRPVLLAGDTSPDIEWVDYTLHKLYDAGERYEAFSILRPTSPFRQPDTIRRAWMEFLAAIEVDSLRAVEKCRQHPGKMWLVKDSRMFPLLSRDVQEKLFPGFRLNAPWHSSQYQALPEVYIQNASLEIAWVKTVFETGTIAGEIVMPFLTMGYEGFDINQPMDIILAETMLASKKAVLPTVQQEPYRMFSPDVQKGPGDKVYE